MEVDYEKHNVLVLYSSSISTILVHTSGARVPALRDRSWCARGLPGGPKARSRLVLPPDRAGRFVRAQHLGASLAHPSPVSGAARALHLGVYTS